MILDGTLKDGEYKFYEDLGNGWAEEIPPISAYGSINVDELNQVIERLGKCPNFDELIKDNNKKDKEIERLNNIINELEKLIDSYELGKYDYEIPVFILKEKLKELKNK